MFGPTRDSFNSHSDSPSKFPKDGPTLWWISNAFILSSEKGQLDMWFMMGLVCEILERRHMRSKYYLQAIENGMQVEFGKNKKRAMTNMHTEYRHTHVTTYCRHTDTHTHTKMHRCLKYLFNIEGFSLYRLAIALVAMTIWIRKKHKKQKKTKAPIKIEQNTNFKDRRETRKDKKGSW